MQERIEQCIETYENLIGHLEEKSIEEQQRKAQVLNNYAIALKKSGKIEHSIAIYEQCLTLLSKAYRILQMDYARTLYLTALKSKE